MNKCIIIIMVVCLTVSCTHNKTSLSIGPGVVSLSSPQDVIVEMTGETYDKLETKIPNLFAVGDGAGITRGLSQASASGVHVARQIGARLCGGAD